MSRRVLDIRDLTVDFSQEGNTVHAVRGVSFHVDRGETVALVGESGSGKSVTALATVDLLPGSAQVGGSVKYDGAEMVGASDAELRRVRGNDISFIFQEPMTSLNPLHTIEKQMAESLVEHGGYKYPGALLRSASAIAGGNPVPVLLAIFGLLSIILAYIYTIIQPETFGFIRATVADITNDAGLLVFIVVSLIGAVFHAALWTAIIAVPLLVLKFILKAFGFTDVVDSELRRRILDLLNKVGIRDPETRLGAYPHQLSGGQRQRVMIAMALANGPELLIADEPTTALDVTIQAQILDLLKRLVKEDGMALMMITHDLAVVSDMADTLNVMRHGEIVEAGPTAQVLREMRHPYTRALFEASRHQADLGTAKADAPLLSVQNVSRDYPLPRKSLFGARPQFRAVKNVSFEIKRGERVGLVGESGCGKSTLTRAILGLEPTQGGQITLDGDPVWQDGHPNLKVRRKMQVVFQDPFGSFDPRWRVARLVAEPFHLTDRPADWRDRVGAALSEVGLHPDDADRHIHEFSGGQRQRIAIARALIIRPDLIVLDEAVSALDVRVRAQVLDLLAGLRRSHGLSYLSFSLDLSVVRGITDRVLVMQKGRIVEDGAAEQVIDVPSAPYTRRLVAAMPRIPKDWVA